MPDAPPAVVLAGGLARRMGGGDKPLLPFGGGTVLSAVLARLAPQAGPLAINANGDPARFAAHGLPILLDPVEGHPGPLAGVLAAMLWARSLGAATILTVPGDAPFLPTDLAARLTLAGAPAFATSGGRPHPIAALWPSALAGVLRQDLADGLRRVQAFATAHGARPVEFPSPLDGPDPFLNLNTPEDLARARRWL
ncbi:Molybdopterin-guanine dinucleotide biosynthesis protein MobA [Rubellimicrobium mesophilum DSM 19309]|uniref:Molybdenum cofactor guanylyltransferase n=1 Tax=Rubellimicrobium mesophilum DSM 19309 TaxID=442562 RepID=A0A017HR77_9RHOB|nr:molybdenum cofactor guanylyltransferase MobA [Rubellimicrobium mesophilum]EYD76881.1 Molybdopterin-guanine dinucleotide biosynthesis protein MobA [Rubellimicrobium mesophilum DSM 19309]